MESTLQVTVNGLRGSLTPIPLRDGDSESMMSIIIIQEALLPLEVIVSPAVLPLQTRDETVR